MKDIPDKKGAWLLMDWELEVKRRPTFGEKIRVNTCAVSVGKPSFHCYRNFEVLNQNNELIATATSKWVFFNFEINKIIKIDSNIINLFNPEGDPKESESKLLKLKEPDSYENVFEYTVKRSDIDINMHMNNLNYLKLAYEALPKEVYLNNELNNVRIMYKHQIKLDNSVKCFYTKQDDGHYISIKSENEKILHAIIKLW